MLKRCVDAIVALGVSDSNFACLSAWIFEGGFLRAVLVCSLCETHTMIDLGRRIMHIGEPARQARAVETYLLYLRRPQAETTGAGRKGGNGKGNGQE